MIRGARPTGHSVSRDVPLGTRYGYSTVLITRAGAPAAIE
jgi:hypothetical protein